jgi:hypothetical protein
VVFNFHAERQPLWSYVEQVFQAANFLQYGATESELVDRVLMNLQPSIQGMAAFLNKPQSRKELDQLIGQLEEKSVVAEKRQRQDARARPSGTVRVSPLGTVRGGPRRPELGVSTQVAGRVVKRDTSGEFALGKDAPAGNGLRPGAQRGPRQEY